MKQVLCVGGVTVDLTVRPADHLPEPGTLESVDQISMSVGGCAANAAIDMGRLGVPTTLCCKIGDDRFGDFILQELEENHVNTAGVVRDGQVGTSASLVTVNHTGERSFLYYPGSTAALQAGDVPRALLDTCDIVFFASVMLLPGLEGKPMAEMLFEAQKAGKYTVMDTVWDFENRWMEKLHAALPYLDLFMPSIDEAKKLSNLEKPEDIAAYFMSMGAKNVILKMGKDGAYVWQEDGTHLHSPAFLQEHPVDTNGAGDAFCAGFLCGLAQGWDYRRSAEFGNAVGSACVMGAGAYSGVGSMADILKKLDSYKR